MKILINAGFKALRTGEFVSAKAEGEFVLDTSDAENAPAVATLIEIGTANKIAVNKKDKKSTILENLEAGFAALKLPEQNKMSESDIVKKIIEAGIAAGSSDDEMLVEIITNKIPFKVAGRLFKQIMEEGGYRVSAAKMKTAVNEILAEAKFIPETATQVQEMITRLVKGCPETEDEDGEVVEALAPVQGLDESTALKAIKAYCKSLEIEMPKTPKATKSETGGAVGGIRGKIFDFMKSNPDADDKAMGDFLAAQGKNEQSAKKNVQFFLPLMQFIKQYKDEAVSAALAE